MSLSRLIVYRPGSVGVASIRSGFPFGILLSAASASGAFLRSARLWRVMAVAVALLLAGVGCDAGTDVHDPLPPQGDNTAETTGELVPIALPCGGALGLPCSKGFTCQLPTGQCSSAGAVGTCVPTPSACLAIYDPVCGCNGKTYGNACEALIAGAQVAHTGECSPPGCGTNLDCGKSAFCEKKGCNVAMGQCQPKPTGCPRIWQPVCGCDGNTYPNDCVRQQNGVPKAYDGQCSAKCGGILGLNCPKGQVCIQEPGTCSIADNIGQCITPPGACPKIWQPVCGCDGNTYGNNCEALMAGISVDYLGACKVAGCQSNADCPANGSYCRKKPGQCDTGLGECVKKPEFCPALYSPVCGCDGGTYGNACEAAAAGTNVLSNGECQKGCFENSQCKKGQYCEKKLGNCDGAGKCSFMPQACPDVWMPVCGCDGKTYGNECEAAASGVNAVATGECPCEPLVCDFDLLGVDVDGDGCEDDCICAIAILCMPGYVPVDTNGNGCDDACKPAKCQSNADCSDDHFCQSTSCNGTGTCSPKPEACLAVWIPVCGCDGVTYSNSCYAHSAGVNVAYSGECNPAGCQSNLDCPTADYCAKDTGDCSGTGQCMLRPQACPFVYAPVCGCDGKTYGNQCFAAAAGVTVSHSGQCSCLPVVCSSAQIAFDTNGDGCPDTCKCKAAIKCAQGFSPVDTDGDGCADVCLKTCQDACDCYDAGLGFDEACPMLCPTCDNYWSCESGLCREKCGPVPPELLLCGSAECQENSDCEQGEYCAKAAGECNGTGQCEPKPQACIALYDPVCGCDGNTYGNACNAAAAGVNVASMGECIPPGGACFTNLECAPGEFCALDGIGCNGPGVCKPKPEICITLWSPVCGCDGQTYSNDCVAASKGVRVASNGECNASCNTDADCTGANTYCKKSPGNCTGAGQCATKPEGCGAVYIPVCGCNGQTYGNACEAAAAGVNVLAGGECPVVGGCSSNSQCAVGQYCAKPVGQCSGMGQCQAKPEMCVAIFDPVCACNGQTYGNSCTAAASGLSVAHTGSCQ